ncbi:Bifunctional polymyxin resistance protein ArnA [Phycisphaerae bacterium RAS1]|nr:Bifunctional polymyxin resistance protein ArnA [Phycisphaerae bacterium RAS1]
MFGCALRTVLVTNGNLLSLLSLGDFLKAHHRDIAAVFITTRLPSQRSNIIGVWRMFLRSGWAYTKFKLLTNRLLPMRLRGKGLCPTVAEYLRHVGSPAEVIDAADINEPAIVERVRGFAPEILLSFSATTRFQDQLVEVPSRAAVNAHYALLPAYAGLSPYFWYLRNGESESGVTLHQIASRLDAGPIIEQRRFAMAGLRTVLGVLRKQMALVSPMLNRFYAGETSEQGAYPQDLSKRSYFRHPTRADVSALLRQGIQFHDREDLDAVEQAARDLLSPAAG